MRLVPTVRTPLTPAEAIAAFYAACIRVLGSVADEALAIIVAQSALETGRWRSLYGFNFGNEKATRTWVGDYYQIRCNEVLGGKLQWFDPPHPQTWFRAFPTADAGAESHVRFLAQNKRYAVAWAAALRGDPAAYAHALKVHGYYTASEALYLRGVVRLFDEFLPIVKATPHAPPAPNADVPVLPGSTEPSEERSTMSEADFMARLKELELPDWAADVATGAKATELDNDLKDTTGA